MLNKSTMVSFVKRKHLITRIDKGFLANKAPANIDKNVVSYQSSVCIYNLYELFTIIAGASLMRKPSKLRKHYW